MTEIAGKKIGEGFGMMGLSWRDPPISTDKAVAALRATLDCNANLWNGGEIYGTPEHNSLHLINDYFTKHPEDADKVVISIKGAIDVKTRKPQGDAAGVRRSVDNCLRVLNGKKKLDMFECARVDPEVPIEDTIETLAEYIKAGKLGSISLSECGPQTIRRAAKVHKIGGVEVEFSLFATEILENGVAAACAENNIPIFAYSPLGRGFLTGQIKSPNDLPESDMRRHMPRFQPGNFEKNMELVHEVDKIAKRKGCTVGQVALAWCQGYSSRPGMPKIIPIPGATTAERIRENYTHVDLSADEMNELDAIVKSCTVHGGRYPEAFSHLNWGETPPRKA